MPSRSMGCRRSDNQNCVVSARMCHGAIRSHSAVGIKRRRVLLLAYDGLALSSLNRWEGGIARPSGARLGSPNLVPACAALANKVRLRRLEEWKREELRRARRLRSTMSRRLSYLR